MTDLGRPFVVSSSGSDHGSSLWSSSSSVNGRSYVSPYPPPPPPLYYVNGSLVFLVFVDTSSGSDHGSFFVLSVNRVT